MRMTTMRWAAAAGTAAIFAVMAPVAFAAPATKGPAAESKPVTNVRAGDQTAVFAGGCFWGMEEVFSALKGVDDVTVGYTGGAAATAHYEEVSTGDTGHAESIRVRFDPRRISYDRLLEVYFYVAHDPTQFNAQAPDTGPQYRSEIFYADDAQRSAAAAEIERVDRSHRYGAPVVTKLERLRAFYPAEAYHQHYAERHPNDPYIVEVDTPRMAQLHRLYPALVR